MVRDFEIPSQRDSRNDLGLVVGELYSLDEIRDKGFKLRGMYSQNTFFSRDDGFLYCFSYQPFKKLKISFKYDMQFQDVQSYSEYDEEEKKVAQSLLKSSSFDDLKNCCGRLRFLS